MVALFSRAGAAVAGPLAPTVIAGLHVLAAVLFGAALFPGLVDSGGHPSRTFRRLVFRGAMAILLALVYVAVFWWASVDRGTFNDDVMWIRPAVGWYVSFLLGAGAIAVGVVGGRPAAAHLAASGGGPAPPTRP